MLAALLLLLSLLVSCARADCDYDDDWCCDPRTWCEAWHFSFYQFLFGMFFYGIVITLTNKMKLTRLARDMIQTGRATPATVVAVQSKRLTKEDAPFTLLEHAGLVEFQDSSRNLVLKWIKITNAHFQEIKIAAAVDELPTLTGQEAFFTSITEERLQSLTSSAIKGGTHQVMIYNWPSYPNSAVSSDARAVEFPVGMKILYSVLLLLTAGGMLFLFGWFAQIYNYNLLEAGAKCLLLLVVQMAAVGLVWSMFACLGTYEKEQNFILQDHVRVVSGGGGGSTAGKPDNNATGYGAAGSRRRTLSPKHGMSHVC